MIFWPERPLTFDYFHGSYNNPAAALFCLKEAFNPGHIVPRETRLGSPLIAGHV